MSQQSTGRAQYGETVSQALTRIRNFVRISRRAVTHPRWEPCARIGLTRICAGAREVTRVPAAKVEAGPAADIEVISLAFVYVFPRVGR